jgi:hypothetical protein
MLSRFSNRFAPSYVARQRFTRAGSQTHSNPRASIKTFSLRRPIVHSRLNVAHHRRAFSVVPLEDYTIETSPNQREKSIEEQYSKKTPLEHVLLRPGMYVGPVERLPPNHCWVLDPLPKPYDFSKELSEVSAETPPAIPSFRMTSKEYGLVPALIKIFDEILVNASDNRLRNPKTCTVLDVRIDPGSPDRKPQIRLYNNGKGIPIQVHAEENMYLPEMLFGHLLTGSNFDDDEKRLTGKHARRRTTLMSISHSF